VRGDVATPPQDSRAQLCLLLLLLPCRWLTESCLPLPHTHTHTHLLAARMAVPALAAEVPPSKLTHVVITHLGPNRFPTLKAVLEAALQGRPAGSPLRLVVTNPARSALDKGLTGARRGVGRAAAAASARVPRGRAAARRRWQPGFRAPAGEADR
jgi:hypothetical protein